MNAVKLLAVCTFAVVIGAGARAEDADLAKMLVGKWVITKSAEGAPPVGTVAEFTKDGKIKVTMKKDDKDTTMEGTYKCEAKKFACTFKIGDEEKVMKHDVSKISDKELIFTIEGKTVEAEKKD
jgi:uncharacterized protein (TIGR03066 family)